MQDTYRTWSFFLRISFTVNWWTPLVIRYSLCTLSSGEHPLTIFLGPWGLLKTPRPPWHSKLYPTILPRKIFVSHESPSNIKSVLILRNMIIRPEFASRFLIDLIISSFIQIGSKRKSFPHFINSKPILYYTV